METKALQELIIRELVDAKANRVIQYDMEGKSAVSDFVVVCQATSTAHAQGISDKVNIAVKKHGVLPLGVEGADGGTWILMDYNVVLIHIFIDELRDHYAIDKIYEDYRQESFQ